MPSTTSSPMPTPVHGPSFGPKTPTKSSPLPNDGTNVGFAPLDVMLEEFRKLIVGMRTLQLGCERRDKSSFLSQHTEKKI
jgi:hypothetical protein